MVTTDLLEYGGCGLGELDLHGLAGALHQPSQLRRVPEHRVVRDLVTSHTVSSGSGTDDAAAVESHPYILTNGDLVPSCWS